MLVVCNVYRAQQSNEVHMLQLSVFSLMYSIDNVQASLTSRSLLLFPKVGGGGVRVQAISNAYIHTITNADVTQEIGTKSTQHEKLGGGGGAISYHRGDDFPNILLQATPG